MVYQFYVTWRIATVGTTEVAWRQEVVRRPGRNSCVFAAPVVPSGGNRGPGCGGGAGHPASSAAQAADGPGSRRPEFFGPSLTKRGVAVLPPGVGVTGERLVDHSATAGDEGEGSDTRGRQEAFVIASYAGLYRWFRHLTASPERAADLTQETFAAFWASAGRRGPGVSPTTWLYAIGRNLWRKRLRDRRFHEPAMLDQVAAGGQSAEQGAQDREFLDAVGLEVARLPPELRETFTLRFWNEFSYQQIGEVQGVEPGLARWRYFTARRRLHGALAAWDPEREQIPEDPHAKFRES